jgi:hypothetical protein
MPTVVIHLRTQLFEQRGVLLIRGFGEKLVNGLNAPNVFREGASVHPLTQPREWIMHPIALQHTP